MKNKIQQTKRSCAIKWFCAVWTVKLHPLHGPYIRSWMKFMSWGNNDFIPTQVKVMIGGHFSYTQFGLHLCSSHGQAQNCWPIHFSSAHQAHSCLFNIPSSVLNKPSTRWSGQLASDDREMDFGGFATKCAGSIVLKVQNLLTKTFLACVEDQLHLWIRTAACVYHVMIMHFSLFVLIPCSSLLHIKFRTIMSRYIRAWMSFSLPCRSWISWVSQWAVSAQLCAYCVYLYSCCWRSTFHKDKLFSQVSFLNVNAH